MIWNIGAFALGLLQFGGFLDGTNACSDFIMRFKSPAVALSGRTMDLGSTINWTIATWPAGEVVYSIDPPNSTGHKWTSIYGTVGISGNWIGDDAFGAYALFGDSLNEKGLSCGLLTLINTVYQEPSKDKHNVFYGVFCKWATQNFATVREVQAALPEISIWGPPVLSEHFVLRDATGASLVIELVDGQQKVYLDLDDGKSGFGIMTNEPQFDWHVSNIKHYQWKRGLARQAVPVPGSWYPEERFLRIHMVKSGMKDLGLLKQVDNYQQAFSLVSQVINTVTVPYGNQYGTDTGESSGEGNNPDHTMWAIIRDHTTPALYWYVFITAYFILHACAHMTSLHTPGEMQIIRASGASSFPMSSSVKEPRSEP